MIVPSTDNGVRPAGRPNQCFYCSSPVGEHKDDCVCLTRTVILELKTRIVVEVPRSWDRSDIEFLYNESSHCADNEFDRIAFVLNSDQTHHCACSCTEATYLGEAEEENNAIDLTRIRPENGQGEER